jgi:thiol-disulfide isomerase/thioredoxin
MKLRAPLACLAVLAPSVSALASDLTVGSPAPALDVKTWLKGTPITKFDTDQVYVVEFWATWCGPCKQSIPHLTELAKKYPKVNFIGVSIWEDDKDNGIKKFVDQMGDKMNYNVGYSGNQTGMAQSWMAAAGQNGIPTAFVIEKGKVDWIGHPMELDQPLGEVTSGKFDLAKFKAEFSKKQQAQLDQQKAMASLNEDDKLYKSGKKAEAKAALAKTVAKYPELAQQADMMKFDWLAKESVVEWRKAAKAALASKDQGKSSVVGSFALMQTQPGGNLVLGKEAIDMALAATQSKDVLTLYYASIFYTRTKDSKSALQVVNKAIAILPTSQFKDDPQLAEIFKTMKTDLEKGTSAAK